MSERMSEDLAIAALQLFEQAPGKLFDSELRDHVTAATYAGIDACQMGISHKNLILALQDLLMMEILRGYWAMARRLIECYEIDNRREDLLTMIFIILGGACYTVGDMEELQRFVESWDSYTQTASDLAKSVGSSNYSIAVARIVEAGWITQAAQMVGAEMPEGNEPESELPVPPFDGSYFDFLSFVCLLFLPCFFLTVFLETFLLSESSI